VNSYSPGVGAALGSDTRIIYAAGDGWDRGGVGFTRPPLIGRSSVTKPYLEDTTVRAALKAKSEPFSRLPLRLWDRDPADPGAREITEHPLATIWRMPNSLLAGEEFFRLHAIGYSLTGATYMFLAEDDGSPIQKGQIPSQIIPVMRPGVRIEDRDAFGMPVTYSYSFGGQGKPIKFPAHAVVAILDHNPYNWLEGFGDVDALFDDIDTNHHALKYLSSFVRSGGDPGAWIKFKNKLGESEAHRLQSEVDDEYSAHGVSRYKVVSGEVDSIIPNPVRPRDLEYEKLLERQRDTVLSMLGVPPPMVGILENATYNNIRQAELLMWRGPNGILSLLRRTEAALNGLFLPRFLGRVRGRGDSRAGRVESTWQYRFDTSDVEVLQADHQDEVDLASKIAASGVGVSMRDALEMLGAEATITDDVEESVDRAWVSATLRPAMDSSGGGTTAVLADLAARVASHSLTRDAAIEIARVTLAGTVEEASLEAMFPDPGPKPAPPSLPEPPPGGLEEKAEEEDPEPDDVEQELSWSHQAYEFKVGTPIEADIRLRNIVETWLSSYEEATLELWKEAAEGASAENSTPSPALEELQDHADHVFEVPKAWESVILAQEEWAALLGADAGPRIEQIFLGAISGTHDVLGGPFISATDPRVVQALATQNLTFAGITETLTEEIRDLLTAVFVETPDLPIETIISRNLPELTTRLQRVFGTKEARANAISRTETGRAQNTAQLMQMEESGVTKIAWIHDGNKGGRANHIALNGSEVKLGEKFANGLRHPHDPDAPASEVVNCACSIRAVAFKEGTR
jgi:phage portal protein BeeE